LRAVQGLAKYMTRWIVSGHNHLNWSPLWGGFIAMRTLISAFKGQAWHLFSALNHQAWHLFFCVQRQAWHSFLSLKRQAWHLLFGVQRQAWHLFSELKRQAWHLFAALSAKLGTYLRRYAPSKRKKKRKNKNKHLLLAIGNEKNQMGIFLFFCCGLGPSSTGTTQPPSKKK